MRKALSTTFVLALCLMFAGATAFACGGDKTADNASAKSSCSASKNTEAKMISADKGSCDASKSTEAKMTSADGKACVVNADGKTCTVNGKTVAIEDCNPADCVDFTKMAAKHGENAEVRMMSVKGMTCTGCENSIKAELTKVAGVLEVAKVCHKGSTAVVIVDKNVIKNDVLTTAVTNKGYEAAIIPAVATTGAASVQNVDAKKACAASCAKVCTDKKAEGASSSSSPH